MSAAGATAEGLTKSAKKRMAQKAKAAQAEEAVVEEAPAAPAPKAKGKAKAKAEAPGAKAAAAPKADAGAAKAAPKAAAEPASAKAKAKADPKAAAKADPKAGAKAAAKADPKAKAKAEAKADAAPKAAAKADPKAKAKGKAKPAKPEEAPAPKEELPINVFLDDGTGGAWEMSGIDKKKKEKKAKDKADGTKDDKKEAASSGAAYGGGKSSGKGGKDDKSGTRAKVVEGAAAEVARILAMKAPPSEDKPVVQAAHIESQIVPEEKIGIVIGPKGTTIQLIQEKTKVARIDTMGGVFTISGDQENVQEAKKAIQEIIARGFCTLNYDDFAEGFVSVHPMYFPDIIGSKGAIIRSIKDQLKVEIKIPETPKEPKPTDKFKITLAGNAEQVEKAKEVINSIVQYQHHEITHPGQTHEELELEQWAYSFIIGRGGSEMKHIQNNFTVKVVIPRENSMNKNVLVVGQPKDAERAKAYIEKVVYEAETKQKKDPRDDKPSDVGDKWGDDDPVEPGCEGYVYKRGS